VDGIPFLNNILEHVQLKSLFLGKNFIGDEGIVDLINGMKENITGQSI
jgi:hypothetical protein